MLLKSHCIVRVMVFIAIVLWLINNYDITLLCKEATCYHKTIFTKFFNFFYLFFYLFFLERLNVLYERNWTLLVHEQLRRFEGTIVAATRGGLVETLGDRLPRWSFSEALLYSVTVITTIG